MLFFMKRRDGVSNADIAGRGRERKHSSRENIKQLSAVSAFSALKAPGTSAFSALKAPAISASSAPPR